jgi:hypothetical protein
MKTFVLLAVVSLAGWLFAGPPVRPAAQPDTSVAASQPDSITAPEPAETGDESATPPAESHPASAKTRPSSQELSTELDGLDTLELAPTEMITQVAGGTRRVHLESTVFRREQPVKYQAAGRRDPFRALLVDEKKEGEIETDLLRIEGAALRGVVWSEGVYLALVTDKDSKSFVLREGDPIYQGRVLSVTQSQAVFEVSDFGDYQKITLKVRRQS